MTRAITVTPLTGSIGARVTGVDLREPIPDAVGEQIREAFVRHSVLVLPDDRGTGGGWKKNYLAG